MDPVATQQVITETAVDAVPRAFFIWGLFLRRVILVVRLVRLELLSGSSVSWASFST